MREVNEMARGKPTREQRQLIRKHGYPAKDAVILSSNDRKIRFFIPGQKGVITLRKSETPAVAAAGESRNKHDKFTP